MVIHIFENQSNVGSFSANFFDNGIVSNKVLQLPSEIDSDITPFVVPANARLTKITYSGSENVDIGFTIQVRVNNSVVYTSGNLTGKKGSFLVLPELEVQDGDLITLYVPNVPSGQNPKDLSVNLYFL